MCTRAWVAGRSTDRKRKSPMAAPSAIVLANCTLNFVHCEKEALVVRVGMDVFLNLVVGPVFKGAASWGLDIKIDRILDQTLQNRLVTVANLLGEVSKLKQLCESRRPEPKII